MTNELAILYARVSGDDHEDASKLDAQLSECREYAVKHGYTILHEFQEDKYSSGADLDLPHLNKVLDLAKDGTFEVLVCRELDRLARDLAKQLYIEDELKRSGVRIEYALERYDDSPEGGLMKHVKASVAEYERIKIIQRTRRGKRRSVEARNVTCCGAPPYGYREATLNGKRTLVVDEEEAEVIRMMYRLYLEGNGKGQKYGYEAIAKSLTDRKIPSHSDKGNTINSKVVSGYGYWSHMEVSRMLQSPVYKGSWQYGKRTDNPITIPVPRIVSDEVWEAAQVRRKKNRRVRKYSGQYDFMLQGDVYCSLCGKPMSPQIKRSPKVAYSYYIHRPHPVHHSTNGNRCTGHANYSAKAVDDAVWAYTKEILSNPGVLAGGFRKYAERLKSGNNPTRDKLRIAQKQVASAERELSRLVILYMKGKISETQYDEMKKPLDIALAHHGNEVVALSRELEQSAKLEDHMQSITKFAEVAAAKLNTKYADKIENRREVIKRLGMRVELGQDDKNRYADTLFVASGLSQIRCTPLVACSSGLRSLAKQKTASTYLLLSSCPNSARSPNRLITSRL